MILFSVPGSAVIAACVCACVCLRSRDVLLMGFLPLVHPEFTLHHLKFCLISKNKPFIKPFFMFNVYFSSSSAAEWTTLMLLEKEKTKT